MKLSLAIETVGEGGKGDANDEENGDNSDDKYIFYIVIIKYVIKFYRYCMIIYRGIFSQVLMLCDSFDFISIVISHL